ncbi:hypothetical protein Spb1_13830 [Planctopirus ephydatiae]|uniref:Uncharacterized protein n=1 Tax=Planctopirus ephydatiae TaxID=2528019 RepID=A0A518GLM4_9PLAN|nr:hypothetical protein Spb1_13830 [Planctopirus ephydatiae]
MDGTGSAQRIYRAKRGQAAVKIRRFCTFEPDKFGRWPGWMIAVWMPDQPAKNCLRGLIWQMVWLCSFYEEQGSEISRFEA